MFFVVFDIESLEGQIVKELGVFKDGIVMGYSFLPKTTNLLFKQTGTLKTYMGLIGTVEIWNILSCHQSFTNIVHLQLNTLQRGWRSVISSQNICVKMWRIYKILVVQKFPNF